MVKLKTTSQKTQWAKLIKPRLHKQYVNSYLGGREREPNHSKKKHSAFERFSKPEIKYPIK